MNEILAKLRSTKDAFNSGSSVRQHYSSLYFNSLYMLKTQGYHPAGIECNPNSNNTISSSCASNVTNVKWLPDS
ncbi:20706_t:CDS:2 [Rhizophagus irregularis]|nr:20706_t:CDS:2 [Rhizophagus irregularis]